MAGHRRSRNAGQQLPPTQRKARPVTRRARLISRFAAATSPTERLAAAADYLRGAASRRHPDPERAEEILRDIAMKMINAGDELLALQAREPLHPTVRIPR